MKKVLPLKAPLLLALLLLSTSVLAADTDGDGADNSVDAFPSDGCATIDTDGDGEPDTILAKGNCLIDNFETGNFSRNAWGNTTSCTTSTCKSEYWHIAEGNSWPYGAKAPTGSFRELTLTRTVPVASTLTFYFNDYGSACVPSPIFGCNSSPGTFIIGSTTIQLGGGSGWKRKSVSLSAGSYTFRWKSGGHTDFFGATVLDALSLDDVGITSLVEDSDDDNDGISDDGDAYPLDTDNDGINNSIDWDDDNDGVPDTIDAAPLNNADTSEIVLPLNGSYKGGRLQVEKQAQ